MVKISIVYKKISLIQKNLSRLQKKQHLSKQDFLSDDDAKDVVLHNLQHAIQGCIDIAAHVVSDEGWGTPGSLSELFYFLEDHKIIPPELVENMVPMAGFRNLVVHQYGDVDYSHVYALYQNRLGNIEQFVDSIQANFPP